MKDFSVKTRITNIIFEKKKPCYLVYINTKGLNLKTSYEFHNNRIMNFPVAFIMHRIHTDFH